MKKRLRIIISILLIILVAQNIYLINQRMWKLKDATGTTQAYIGGVISEIDKLQNLVSKDSNNEVVIKTVQNIKMNLHDVRNLLGHTKDFVDSEISTADNYFRTNEEIISDIIKDNKINDKELKYIKVLREEMIELRQSIISNEGKKDFLTVSEFKRVFGEIGDYSENNKNEENTLWNKYKHIIAQ